MAQHQVKNTLEEQLRNEGFELEGNVKLGPKPEHDPSVILYVPLAPKSGYDAKTFATIRKVADALKSGSVYADINPYAVEGIDKLVAAAKEAGGKLAEKYKDKPEELKKQATALKEGLDKKIKALRNENYVKQKKSIDGTLAHMNKVWEGASYTPKITPPDYQVNTALYRNLESDLNGEAAAVGQGLAEFVEEYSKRPATDLKNLYDGKHFYIVKLGKIKDEKGKEGIAIVEAKIYRKIEKEAAKADKKAA